MTARWVVLVAAACGGKHDAPAPVETHAAPAAAHAERATISGRVLDAHDQAAVGGAHVVLRGPDGEHETTTSVDGSYTIAVAPATYRVFVRDDRVLSAGAPDRVRLDPGPRETFAGRPDETIMPALAATGDLANVDLEVERIARLAGRVIDFDGRPVGHAVVRATGGPTRPVLGTDIVVTSDTGEYELRVPEGRYAIDVSHPKYATTTQRLVVVTHAAFPTHTTLEVDPGCIISGKVTTAGGAIANDGAIEREGAEAGQFVPAGRIDADGTFRFTTLEEGPVALRGWPWQTAPSQAKPFACRSGARFTDVKLVARDAPPALYGKITDAAGAPLPFAYFDLRPLVGTGPGQQERADAGGTWSVHDLLPGQYELTTSVPGRGIAVVDVSVPGTIDVTLSGTGRIAGTVTSIVDGTLAVSFQSCSDAFDAQKQPLQIPHEPRLVPVAGGRFVIDGAPACHLTFAARWHGMQVETNVDVHRGETSIVELALGEARKKTVTGIVRDASQHAIGRAHVTASFAGKEIDASDTDGDGRFTLHAPAGSEVRARDGLRSAAAIVSPAAVEAEQLELVLDQ